MEFLDLCDDILEIVIDKLYKVRSDENLKHFEYIVRHALRTGTKRWNRTQVMPIAELSYKHTRQYFLVVQSSDMRTWTALSSLISHHWSRGQIQNCFSANRLIFKKSWNRKQMCAALLGHNISHGMVGRYIDH